MLSFLDPPEIILIIVVVGKTVNITILIINIVSE
jgi:hypothetical protein